MESKIRTLLSGLTTLEPDYADWEHITKVDPEKLEKTDPGPVEAYALDHSDAAMIGGSDGVNPDNTYEAIEWVRENTDLPAVHEPGAPEQVSWKTLLATDGLFVPEVANGDEYHRDGAHKKFSRTALEKAGEIPGPDILQDFFIDWLKRRTVVERYVIQNTDSKAADVSGVEDAYDMEELVEEASYSRIIREPDLFYIERSGEWSDKSIEEVKAASHALGDTPLFYGGGVDSSEKARAIHDAGATVVVGDYFHEDPEGFIETTKL